MASVGGCATANQQDPTPSGSNGPARVSAGQTLDAAREQLKFIAGLADTSIEADKTASGLNKHRQVLVEGSVENAAELSALVDNLAQLGWSVNQEEPDTGMALRLVLSPQPAIGDVAQAEGWTDGAYSTSTDRLKQMILLPASALQDRFGAWPGLVPDTLK